MGLQKLFAKEAIKSLYKRCDPETQKAIQLDAIHKKEKSFSMELLIERIQSFPQFRNVFLWRIHNDTSKYRLKRLYEKVFKMVYPVQDTVEIYVRSGEIGPNLWLPHRYCVINAEKIGENVSVLQGVTIGADSKNRRPTIGDNVVIYPNSVIVGNIKIGSNSYIGANCFVDYDVPDNSTVRTAKSVCTAHDNTKLEQEF